MWREAEGENGLIKFWFSNLPAATLGHLQWGVSGSSHPVTDSGRTGISPNPPPTSTRRRRPCRPPPRSKAPQVVTVQQPPLVAIEEGEQGEHQQQPPAFFAKPLHCNKYTTHAAEYGGPKTALANAHRGKSDQRADGVPFYSLVLTGAAGGHPGFALIEMAVSQRANRICNLAIKN